MGIVTFVGGKEGAWRVTGITPIAGSGLGPVDRIQAIDSDGPALRSGSPASGGTWRLRGLASNHRYATRAELTALDAVQPVLGRPEATCASLIPIRKSDAWWRLAQDERRAVFGMASPAGTGHNDIGLDYLPGVARRLLHCRDLGEAFDFLTWFEFAPDQTAAFTALLARLRATPEWSYVEREVEIRLER